MSPGGLGRCLRCGDAAFERLALLEAAGLAGSRRLPKVKAVLTLAAPRFDALVDRLTGRAGEGAAGGDALLLAALGSDANPGAGEDSDDEEDSGLLWPPERPAVERAVAGGGDAPPSVPQTAAALSVV
jgi:hypothetical protein